MKQVGTAKATLFEDFLVVGLAKEWLEVFSEPPTFNVTLDKQGKLNLKSTKSISYTKYTK